MTHKPVDEALRQDLFGPDKILGPEHAAHVRGVVIRAINRHASLGILRERIADAVAEALTGKVMHPDTVKPQSEDRVHRLGQPPPTPVTYIDLLTGQAVDEGAEWCPDCKRLAEEDGDILPPACAAHGGPPGALH